MAAAITGTGTLHQTQADGSFAITIPADADAVFVVVTGYNNTSNADLIAELNFDDGAALDFTLTVEEWWDAGAYQQIQVFHMVDSDGNWPGTGAQTLYYARAGSSYSQGYNFYAFYVSGADVTSLIVDTDSDDSSSSSPWTSSLIGVGADDLTVGAAYLYTTTTGDVDPGGYGQTALTEQSNYNGCGIAVGYEVGEGSFRIEASTTNFIPVAFTVNAAAASGPSAALVRRRGR